MEDDFCRTCPRLLPLLLPLAELLLVMVPVPMAVLVVPADCSVCAEATPEAFGVVIAVLVVFVAAVDLAAGVNIGVPCRPWFSEYASASWK